MKNVLIALICFIVCSSFTNNETPIIVKEFNDYNEKKIDNLKNLSLYRGEYLKDDGEKAYGISFTIDTSAKNHVLYIFIEESPIRSNQNPHLNWKIIAGLKVENLNPTQTDATCTNSCYNPKDSTNDYIAIIRSFENDEQVDIYKSYKLDFKKKKFVENLKEKIVCDIDDGE